MTATVLRADALHLPIADETVDLVVTSPPYFGLRSYTDTPQLCDRCRELTGHGWAFPRESDEHRNLREAWPDWDQHIRDHHVAHPRPRPARPGGPRRQTAISHRRATGPAQGDAVTTLAFRVDGTPKPKGSMRHVGRGRMVEQVAGSAPWRERVLWAAKDAARADRWERYDGPVSVFIVCSFSKPPSAPKKRRWYPTSRTTGDADKLARNVLDALVDAGIIRDDAAVTRLSVHKQQTRDGENPSAHVAVIT